MADTVELLDHTDVSTFHVAGRTIFLVATAHIARESVDLVREIIAGQKPDCVCVELDEKRLAALRQPDAFAELDLREIIRSRQLSTLLVNLVLASYQKRLGSGLGVVPGSELLEAVRAAEASGVAVALCDRDVRVTLRRAWATLGWWKKCWFFSALVASIFDRTVVDQRSLRELRGLDVTARLIEELGREFPSIKTVLIDERDTYLAEKIRRAPGRRLVAVVGAAHRAGVGRKLVDNAAVDLAPLEAAPPLSPAWKTAGWGVPAVVFGLIAYIGWAKGAAAAGENVAFWIVANAIPSFIGAAAAFAHPLTIACAFAAAPITALTPVIGVGHVCAFLQAYLRPPLVRELQKAGEDAGRLRCWWSNRLLRILLVFAFTSIGGVIGTFVGGAEIVSNLY